MPLRQGLMSLIRSLLIPWAYLAAAAALSAVIAYPILLGLDPTNVSLLRSLVSRLGQALLLLGLLPLRRSLNLSAALAGLEGPVLKGFLLGFFLGTVTLVIHGSLLVQLDLRLFAPPVAGLRFYLSGIASALAAGVSVALLEEFLFRGVLLGLLLRWSNPMTALVISAFDYAILHFISSQWTSEPSELGFDSGFRIALDGFAQLATADPSSLVALFAAGLMLGLVRLRVPGGLYAAIGLHAGWVTQVKLIKALTVVKAGAPWLFLIGRYDQVIGLLSLVWLLPLIAFLLFERAQTGGK